MDVQDIRAITERVRGEVRKAVVGQDAVIDLMLTSLLVGGHILLEGVPGTAKTMITRAFAAGLHLQFGRIQFTPDLMPGDVLGTNLFNFQTNGFVLTKGPIFTQVLLADEINRTPPKTQAALLEAMQEYHVTAAGRTYPLERPFFVLATQNPIELEGTYPLPEAQLDRFMFNVVVTYLTEDDEVRVVTQTTGTTAPAPSRVLNGAEILEYQQLVRQVIVAEDVARYAVRLVDASRPGRQADLPFVKEWVKWGAGLRASQSLILASKARALMLGRYHVAVADIRALAQPILRHRIIPNFYAESEKVTSDIIVDKLIEAVPAPRSGL